MPCVHFLYRLVLLKLEKGMCLTMLTTTKGTVIWWDYMRGHARTTSHTSKMQSEVKHRIPNRQLERVKKGMTTTTRQYRAFGTIPIKSNHTAIIFVYKPVQKMQKKGRFLLCCWYSTLSSVDPINISENSKKSCCLEILLATTASQPCFGLLFLFYQDYYYYYGILFCMYTQSKDKRTFFGEKRDDFGVA